MEQIKSIMNTFRTSNIEEIAGIRVAELKDYSKDVDGLPKSDVLKFILEDGSWIAVRPSDRQAPVTSPTYPVPATTIFIYLPPLSIYYIYYFFHYFF